MWLPVFLFVNCCKTIFYLSFNVAMVRGIRYMLIMYHGQSGEAKKRK